MVNYFKNIKGVKVYTDEYMEEEKILKCGTENKIYIVTNPKTANVIYDVYKKSLRKNKLKRILKE